MGDGVAARAQRIINASTWQFAKTLAFIPHEYIISTRAPTLRDFQQLREIIAEQGHPARFKGTDYKYLRIGEYQYWETIDRGEPIVNRTFLGYPLKIKENPEYIPDYWEPEHVRAAFRGERRGRERAYQALSIDIPAREGWSLFWQKAGTSEPCRYGDFLEHLHRRVLEIGVPALIFADRSAVKLLARGTRQILMTREETGDLRIVFWYGMTYQGQAQSKLTIIRRVQKLFKAVGDPFFGGT